MEEMVSRRARIVEAAIKSSLFGIILVFAIAILQIVSDEVLTVIQFILIDLVIFLSVGGGAAGAYRAAYGRDALGVAAAGAISGGLMGLLTAFTYVLIGLQLSDPISVDALTESAATESLMYVICICPMLFIGAASSAAVALGMNYLPAIMLGIKDMPQTNEDKHEEAEEGKESEVEDEIEEELEIDDPVSTGKLRQAIQLLEIDRKAEARNILITLVRENKQPDPLTWLWLASTLDHDLEKKRLCIQKVLEQHPTSPVALEMLNNLEKPILPPAPSPPMKVPITFKPAPPTLETKPQELSYGAQVGSRFSRLLKARMIWAAITVVIIFICNGIISLFQ